MLDLFTQTKERGDIAIYTALIVVTMMLSGALSLSIILSRQIPATAELLNVERAFYAGVSGREAAYYVMGKQNPTDTFSVYGTIQYSDGREAIYSGDDLELATVACGIVEGDFQGLRRRFELLIGSAC